MGLRTMGGVFLERMALAGTYLVRLSHVMPQTESAEERFLPTRRSLLSRLRNLEDAQSWQDFFETYWKLIYNAAIQANLSHDEAQDVVQETVLTVTRKIGGFRYDPEVGSFKGWLLNTTRWRILDQLRHRKPEARNQVDGNPGENGLAMDQLEDPAGERIERMWELEWQKNLVDAAMRRIQRQIKPKHFQVFDLYVLKGWPARKVAATLGVNIAQVHLLKHRVSALIKKEVRRLQEQGI